MKHKPTKNECRIIRECAQHSAGYGKVELCPGTRYNLDGRYQEVERDNLNIAFVTDQPGWEDTDLADNAWTWRDFTRGVTLTENGRGIFDFYVYAPLGNHKELQTNVTAYYEGGKLVRVDGTGNGTLWEQGVYL